MESEGPIRTLIVDDEAPARDKLQRYLDGDERFKVIGQAENGARALELIVEFQPQLLLLDIQMPGMTGFDVLRLMDGYQPSVIFITAYDQYAVQAFDVSAVDYLLKPVAEERFAQAMDKVFQQGKQDWQSKIQTVLDKVSETSTTSYIKRLPVRKLKKVYLLPVEDISHIVSENRLVQVYDHQGQRFWTGETLSQLERRLDPEFFFRIHRSSILNISQGLEIEPWEDGRLKVRLANDNTLVVSRGPAIRLREKLEF